MTRLSFLYAQFLLALLLAGCNPSKPVEPIALPQAPLEAGTRDAGLAALPKPAPVVDHPVKYQCKDFEFEARYDENEVVLLIGNDARVLQQVVATTGARYEGEGAVLVTSESEALLELDGQTYAHCQEQALAAAPLAAPPFSARGSAPDWSLEIVPGDRMVLRTNQDKTRVETLAPPALEDEGAIVYHARTATHELSVRIEPTPCTDAQSGVLYAATTLVRLNGQDLRGCGGTLAVAANSDG